MSSLRKKISASHHRGSERTTAACPPEAFDYDDDVTPAAVEQLRQEAADRMSRGKWTVIDGYVGNNKQAPHVG